MDHEEESVTAKTSTHVTPTKEEMDTLPENYREKVQGIVDELTKCYKKALQANHPFVHVGCGFVCFVPACFALERSKLLVGMLKAAISGFAVVREPDIAIRHDPTNGTLHTTVSIVLKV